MIVRLKPGDSGHGIQIVKHVGVLRRSGEGFSYTIEDQSGVALIAEQEQEVPFSVKECVGQVRGILDHITEDEGLPLTRTCDGQGVRSFSHDDGGLKKTAAASLRSHGMDGHNNTGADIRLLSWYPHRITPPRCHRGCSFPGLPQGVCQSWYKKL